MTKVFPRGGKQELTPLELRDITDKAKQDLFKESTLKRKEIVTDEVENVVNQAKKAKVQPTYLTYKRLNIGMSLVGVVKQINELDLEISLPNQLVGYVSITEISDYITNIVEAAAEDDSEIEIPDLNSYFSRGDHVICCITALENKRIDLSLNPLKLNQKTQAYPGNMLAGVVSSKEDHGYLIDLGIENIKGFLPKNQVSKDISIGSVLCTVVKKVDGNVAQLSTNVEKLLGSSSNPSYENLVAGALVQAKVSQIFESGLVVSFLGIFEGSISLNHLNIGVKLEKLSEFKKGQKIQCRLLYVDNTQKVIGLSRLSPILTWSNESIPLEFKIGDVIPSAKVLSIDPKLGLFVDLNSQLGYVHISKLHDNRIENIEKKFTLGDQKKGRIIGYDYCDKIWLLSFEESVVSQPFISLADIQVGVEVKGTIKKIESFGIIVAITNSINGLCPSLHLSDIKMSHPEKLFKIGSKMTFRVLSVEQSQNRLILTHKKSLMDMKYQPFIDYSKIKSGDISVGVITAVKNFGCIVTFFNEVRALVPLSELGHEKITSVTDHFAVGKSIKCQVLSVNAAEQKLRVSFRVSQLQRNLTAIGSVHDFTYVSCTTDGIIVTIEDSDSDVFVPATHLHDQLKIAAEIHEHLFALQSKKRFVIGKGIITKIDSKKNIILGTLKNAVVSQAEHIGFINNISSLQEGKVFAAVVENFTDRLCFVSIGSVTAVANIHNVMDGFLDRIDNYLKIGQTVLVAITNIDVPTNKIFVSLKNSLLLNSKGLENHEKTYLASIFSARSVLFRILKKDTTSKWMLNYAIGSQIQGQVGNVSQLGVTIKLEHKVTGWISLQNSTLKEGDNVSCQVIDVDICTRIVDLRLQNEPVNVDHQKKLEKKFFNETRFEEGIVELLKDDYAVVLLKSLNYAIGFVLNRPVNNALLQSSRFKIGQVIKVQPLEVISVEATMKRNLLAVAHDIPKSHQTVSKKDLKSPIDTTLFTLDDIMLGRVINGKIQSIKETQINIKIADNLRGRVHATQIYESYEQIVDPKNPLASFKTGDNIRAKVIGFHDVKTHKYLPISHTTSASQTVVELSILPDCLDKDLVPDLVTFEKMRIHSWYTGFVHKIEKTALWVQISPTVLGRIDSLQVSRDSNICSNLDKYFNEGAAIKCCVISKDEEKHYVDLSMLEPSNSTNLVRGDVLLCRIIKIDPLKGINVYIRPNQFGRIILSELNDKFVENPCQNFQVNQYVTAIVLSSENGKTELTLKKDRQALNELVSGDITQGFVSAITEKGCFVSLSNDITARVKIAALSDEYVKDWKSIYKIGQLVKGKIIHVDLNRKQVELSLKVSDVDPSKKKISIEDLIPQSIVDGEIKKIEAFGVFIQIENSDIRGLCHKSELSDRPVIDITKIYEVGDRVQAFILKTDVANKKVSLSLKSSYFEALSELSDEEVISHSNELAEEDDMIIDTSFEADATMSIKAPLTLEGFTWDSSTIELRNSVRDSEEESESEDDDIQQKRNRRSTKREREEKEKSIAAKEKSLLDSSAAPEMPEDFERLLIGSPNNSFIWIKYMAFQLELAETEKARKIADRALATISFREEQEKLNILVAYLNLENKFGDKESLQNVFDKACQISDPKKVHIQLVRIYDRNDQHEDAEELYKKMVKKFNTSCKIWLEYALFHLKKDAHEFAKNIVTRSLKSLPKHKHIKILTKFGQMEFKIGDPERGRTLFEGLVSTYPKRIDLWSIYLDMEIRVGVVDICRRLFERILMLKWSTKKMQFLFKKYSSFEKSHGTPEGVNHVVQSAKKYLQSLNQ